MKKSKVIQILQNSLKSFCYFHSVVLAIPAIYWIDTIFLPIAHHYLHCTQDLPTAAPPTSQPRCHYFLPWISCFYYSRKANDTWSVIRHVVCLYQLCCRLAGNIPMKLIKWCICLNRVRSSCLKRTRRQLFQWEFYHLVRSLQQMNKKEVGKKQIAHASWISAVGLIPLHVNDGDWLLQESYVSKLTEFAKHSADYVDFHS